MEIQFRADREAHLKKLCAEMGRSVDDIAGEAILTFMEDYEDAREAQEVIDRNEPTYTLEEVERHLGLDRSDLEIGGKTA